jgi:hypothetical protein
LHGPEQLAWNMAGVAPYEPAAHCVQALVAPLTEKEPAGHTLHATVPFAAHELSVALRAKDTAGPA